MINRIKLVNNGEGAHYCIGKDHEGKTCGKILIDPIELSHGFCKYCWLIETTRKSQERAASTNALFKKLKEEKTKKLMEGKI